MRRWLSHEHTLALHLNWNGIVDRDIAACDEVLLAQFKAEQPWGVEIAIDGCACNRALISDPAYLQVFAEDFCEKFQLRCDGELFLTQHGEGERLTGYTLVQLVQSAHVVAHFVVQSHAVYVNLVTCSFAPPVQCAVLCQQWFAAQHMRLSVVFRGQEQGAGHQLSPLAGGTG